MYNSSHPLYGLWAGMKQRCYNPNNPMYKYYGAKGIKVCNRWLHFSLFVLDMGDRPSPRHSIDRIDPDKGYEPGNCRWATPHEQGRSIRNNITDDEIRAIKQLIREGVSQSKIAAKFGRTQSAISHIATGRNGSHVTID